MVSLLSTSTDTSTTAIPGKDRHLRGWLPFAVRIVIGLSLLVALFWAIDIRAVSRSLTSICAVPVIALCIMALIERVLKAYKWNLLLRARQISISLWQAMRLYYVGNLFGAFTPGRIGTEAYRVTALSSFRKTQVVISTIILERFIGLAVTCIFAAIGLPVSAKYLGTNSLLVVWIILAVATSAVLGVWISLSPSFIKGVTRQLPYLLRIKFAEKLQEFYHTYAEYRTHRHTLSAFTALTALHLTVLISLIYLAARSFDIGISFGFLVCTMPLILILLLLPVSIDGIGVQEGLFAYLFVIAGFSAADGLSISLLFRLTQLMLVYLPGSIMLWLCPVRVLPSVDSS